MKTFILPLLTGLCFLTVPAFSQPGKDGAETISSAGIIFNRYDKLAASASIGSITITVSNISNLAASAIAGAGNNPYATNALSAGDLLMIIKMQGASINTTNTASYGAITSYNGTGNYELAVVSGVSGNVITLSAALTKSFTISTTERVQVVRIPRLSGLTINSGSDLTALAWSNSYTGGIVAIEVNGNAVINGSINTTGLGFRGGATENDADISGNFDYVNTSSFKGAEKGESIAGSQSDYDALGGRYTRGAPANGGGGGNAHNAGGGGGANTGVVGSWTGNGVPDISVASWAQAWNLESPGFATSSSSGGGRGGYGWSKNNRDALTLAAGGSLWGGDDRRNAGGFGGRPLTYTASTLFFGGGGGAGDANQSSGGAGGNGGGIIYLTVSGTVSGTGSIVSNGANGGNTFNIQTDAAGGGGAGGAVYLNVQGAVTGITVQANGGTGGSQLAGSGNEAEGPGGGGGAGYVAVTGTPSISISMTGGMHGSTASTGLTEFTPNGATSAGLGSTTTVTYSDPPGWGSPLAVKILSFDIENSTNGSVKIKWSASNEGQEEYIVERSNDQLGWTAVAHQNAVGGSSLTNTYTAYDNIGAGTTWYYRLKTVEPGHSSFYSRIIKIQAGTAFAYSINEDHISLRNIPAQVKSVGMYSISGAKIAQVPVTNQYSLDIPTGLLRNGIYLLSLGDGAASKVIRFVK